MARESFIRLVVVIKDAMAAARQMDIAARRLAASAELFNAALRTPRPTPHDPACERFLIAAMRPHRKAQYPWRPRIEPPKG